MIRRIFNLYSFAMLKANKVRPEASLSIEQINRCR